MALSANLVKFANGDTTFYEAAIDYFHNPDSAKSELLNKAFFAEVERQSNVARDGLTSSAWISHPSVGWASLAIVDATINAILPKVFTNTFNLVTDIRTAGVGDMVKFKIRPNSFYTYTVSKGGRGERTTMRQKSYDGNLVLSPIEHMITVYADMYAVLAGKEDIGEFIRMAVLAVRNDMETEALSAMTTGLGALSAPYSVSGAFDMATLVNLCEQIQVYNGGVAPVIAGSASALMKVLPNSSLGFRGVYEADNARISLIKNVYDFDVLKLDQAATAAGGLLLPTNKVYVISPSQDKLVKGVISGDMTNADKFYDNADITQNYTQRSSYAFAYATAAKAGIYTITD